MRWNINQNALNKSNGDAAAAARAVQEWEALVAGGGAGSEMALIQREGLSSGGQLSESANRELLEIQQANLLNAENPGGLVSSAVGGGWKTPAKSDQALRDSPDYYKNKYDDDLANVASVDLANDAQKAFFKLQTGGDNTARIAYMDKLMYSDPEFAKKSREASRAKYEELARQGKYGGDIAKEQRLRDEEAAKAKRA